MQNGSKNDRTVKNASLLSSIQASTNPKEKKWAENDESWGGEAVSKKVSLTQQV